MPTGFVRHAHAGDAPDIAAVQAAAWAQRFALTVPPDALPSPAELASGWSEVLAAGQAEVDTVLVAYQDSAIVGVLADSRATDPDLPDGWRDITELAVDPAHAGEGHGSRLLAAWADFARTDGHTGAVLWIAADDDALRALASSAGFDADGAHRTLDLHGDGTVTLRSIRLATTL